MPVARKVGERWDHVLLVDRKLPKESQSLFHLGSLTASAEDEITDLMHVVGADAEPQALARAASSALRRGGLWGWDNFKGSDGKSIPFAGKDGCATEEDLNQLQKIERLELGFAIINRNRLTEKEQD